MKFFYFIVILTCSLIGNHSFANSSAHITNFDTQTENYSTDYSEAYSVNLQNNPQGTVTIIPKNVEKIFEDIFINNFHTIGNDTLPRESALRRIESDLISDFYVEKDLESKTFKLFSRSSPGEIFTCEKSNKRCFIRTDYHSSVTLYSMLNSLYSQFEELAKNGHGSLKMYDYISTNQFIYPETEGIANEFSSIRTCIDNSSHFINFPNTVNFKLVPSFNYHNKSIDFSPRELRYDNDLVFGTFESCDDVKPNLNRCRAIMPSYRLPNQKTLEFKCQAGKSTDLNLKIAISVPAGSKMFIDSVNIKDLQYYGQPITINNYAYDIGFVIRTSHAELLTFHSQNILPLLTKYNLQASFNNIAVLDLQSFQARNLLKNDIDNIKSQVNLSTSDLDFLLNIENILFRPIAGTPVQTNLFTNLELLVPESDQEISVKFNLDRVYDLSYGEIIEKTRENIDASQDRIKVNFTL